MLLYSKSEKIVLMAMITEIQYQRYWLYTVSITQGMLLRIYEKVKILMQERSYNMNFQKMSSLGTVTTKRPLKMMRNTYFMLKALSSLDIFTLLS